MDDRGSEKIAETPRENGRHSHLGVDDIKTFFFDTDAVEIIS